MAKDLSSSLFHAELVLISLYGLYIAINETHNKINYTPIAFDERVTFLGFNAPGHCLVRAQAYTQIMQHTHTHKAVTVRVEAKKLPSRRRQSNYLKGLGTM